MPRPVTLFTGQWADLPLEDVARKAKEFGFDGLELACWGDHFDVARALAEDGYCEERRALLARHGLAVHAISNHLVGQAVCDAVDERHKSILPPHVWGDGVPDGVKARASKEMQDTARAAAKLGVKIVAGFTGSSIWPLLYSFPPVPEQWIDKGYEDFAARWNPILDTFDDVGVRFALEVHPTEIAFDISSAQRTLDAIGNRPAFGFNYDPSHLGYQGVDYAAFIHQFGSRIYHVHMKDVWWSGTPRPSGVFGGHLAFGHPDRFWEFRSLGRGRIDFEEVVRQLNAAHYDGPLSVEWEDIGMDREHGAREACAFVRSVDFPPARAAFDSAFSRE